MIRFVLYGLVFVSVSGCKSNDLENEDDGGFGSTGAKDLPGGANELPSGDDDSDGDGDDNDGNLGGLDDGGDTTGGGGSSTGGGTVYAGGYPTNPCESTPTSTGLGIGDISPDWELQDKHGEAVRLSDFCGSVVLLESVAFW